MYYFIKIICKYFPCNLMFGNPDKTAAQMFISCSSTLRRISVVTFLFTSVQIHAYTYTHLHFFQFHLQLFFGCYVGKFEALLLYRQTHMQICTYLFTNIWLYAVVVLILSCSMTFVFVYFFLFTSTLQVCPWLFAFPSFPQFPVQNCVYFYFVCL